MAASDLWVEKWRPNTINEYVFRDENLKKQMETWVKEKSLPTLMLTGSPGTGKTSAAKMLFKELDINPLDILEINASRTNSVDDVRDKIVSFVQMIPFGDYKVVLLDECLDENTLVSVMRDGQEEKVKIKDLEQDTDLVKSFNVEESRVEWKTFQLFDKGHQETIEIEFETGDVVVCTTDHKWYVENEHGEAVIVKASELDDYEHILSPK